MSLPILLYHLHNNDFCIKLTIITPQSLGYHEKVDMAISLWFRQSFLSLSVPCEARSLESDCESRGCGVRSGNSDSLPCRLSWLGVPTLAARRTPHSASACPAQPALYVRPRRAAPALRPYGHHKNLRRGGVGGGARWIGVGGEGQRSAHLHTTLRRSSGR